MNKLLMSIGWILLAGGMSSADSESMLIPTVMTFTGAIMIYFESKKC